MGGTERKGRGWKGGKGRGGEGKGKGGRAGQGGSTFTMFKCGTKKIEEKRIRRPFFFFGGFVCYSNVFGFWGFMFFFGFFGIL